MNISVKYIYLRKFILSTIYYIHKNKSLWYKHCTIYGPLIWKISLAPCQQKYISAFHEIRWEMLLRIIWYKYVLGTPERRCLNILLLHRLRKTFCFTCAKCKHLEHYWCHIYTVHIYLFIYIDTKILCSFHFNTLLVYILFKILFI